MGLNYPVSGHDPVSFKIYSLGDYIKNNLKKYFVHYVRNDLIIHLTNSLEKILKGSWTALEIA